ncbi:MAG: tetratricopeptide repeat protein [Geobacter sp.]
MKLLTSTLVLGALLAGSTFAAAQPTTQQAVAEYDRENYEEALAMLQSARQDEGGSALNDYYTGLALKQTGDEAGAVASLTAALQGPQPKKDAVVDLVSLLINLDRTEDAWKWVTWAEREQVRPKDMAYLKGLLQFKQRNYPEAIAAFEAARTGAPEVEQQVDLQIALAYARDGKTTKARENLKAIVTRYPGSDAATFASEYDQRISTLVPPKPWHLYAGIGYLYDDNVTLKSRVPGGSFDTRKREDSGITEHLRLEYDTPLDEQWSANLQYALQNNNYFRRHEYDMLVHGLTATLINRNENGMLALPFNLSHATLDYHNYSLQASLKPTFTVPFSQRQLGQLSLGYTYRDMFDGDDNGPANDRTASIVNLQLGYIFLFAEGRGLLNLRSEGFHEGARGEEWRNNGLRIGADLLAPLTDSTKLILTAESTWQDYTDSSSDREDTTLLASATLNQRITPNIYVNLQYFYTREISNVALYDYRRNVVMTGIEFRY